MTSIFKLCTNAFYFTIEHFLRIPPLMILEQFDGSGKIQVNNFIPY